MSGRHIEGFRVSRGWSHEELARRVGMSPRELLAFQEGWRPLDEATVQRIADALGVPSDVLVEMLLASERPSKPSVASVGYPGCPCERHARGG